MERKWIGGTLIALGLLFLIGQAGLLDNWITPGEMIALFWPTLFVIPLGIAFHLGFFFGGRHLAGLLVPGGILLGTGVVSQFATLFDGWSYMWPGYLASVALGLFELYLFGIRQPALLIPVGILGGLSVIFFAIFGLGQIGSLGRYALAGLLIAFGVLVLSRGEGKGRVKRIKDLS
ncbi:hypothetical protein [Tumebacillus lipolyticus]|uniref:DUF5668 domain-containing protein n=1 Tax=Tumebacillus lipolyticus TaxID=1280370 RepID=A0ABW5A1U5_9BACL